MFCVLFGHKPLDIPDASFTVRSKEGVAMLPLDLCSRCKVMYWKPKSGEEIVSEVIEKAWQEKDKVIEDRLMSKGF